MLFNRTAELYRYSRNSETKISSYNKIGDINCNIQPVDTKDGIDGGRMYKTLKLYTESEDIKVGDKIIYNGVEFIVNSFENWNGLRHRYNKAFIEQSEGN